jgi:hypothetical protein
MGKPQVAVHDVHGGVAGAEGAQAPPPLDSGQTPPRANVPRSPDHSRQVTRPYNLSLYSFSTATPISGPFQYGSIHRGR